MNVKKLSDLMSARRSIRSFTDQEVSTEKLKLIAEAGRYAPTASNQQLRKFTIVKNMDLIQQLGQVIGEEIAIKDYNFYGASSILLISLPKDYENSSYEIGLAVQNAWLAATSLGLGMVWTHQINGLSDKPSVRKILDLLAIPADHLCFNVMAIDVPAEEPLPKSQRETIEIIK